MGAETLSDQVKPPGQSWEEFTVGILNAAVASERSVLFDLTYVQDLDNLLNGLGRYADSITAIELRHIHRNWLVFGRIVQFYENGAEREAPWKIQLF